MTEFCTHCGENAVSERVVEFAVKHDGKTATIDDHQLFCSNCGNISYSGSLASKRELAIAAAIRMMDGLLSAEELRLVRAKYKLLQTDMERILSTGPKTWTRWERGKVPQSKQADKLIRLMAGDPDLAHQLMMDAGVQNNEAEEEFQRIEREAKLLASLRVAKLQRPGGLDAESYVNQVIEDNEIVKDARRVVAARTMAA